MDRRFDLAALVQGDPEGLGRRIAMAIALSPLPTSPASRGEPVFLERPRVRLGAATSGAEPKK